MSAEMTTLTPIAAKIEDAFGTEATRYVTDGTRLLRLLGRVDQGDVGAAVALEDCHSLEVVLVPAEEFGSLRPGHAVPAVPTGTVASKPSA